MKNIIAFSCNERAITLIAELQAPVDVNLALAARNATARRVHAIPCLTLC